MQDPTLQQQVFEYIKKAAEKIGDFTQREIPPFIEEFLQWKFVENAVYVGFGITALFVVFCGLKCWSKRKSSGKMHGDEDIFFVAASIIYGLLTIAVTGGALVPLILEMIQIKIAPKVFLLETAAEYLK